MKVFLIVISFFLHSQLYARDCLQESHNFRLGVKLGYKLNDLIEEYRFGKKTVQELCENKDSNDMWAAEVEGHVSYLKEQRKELATDKSKIKEIQICTELDSEFKESISCTFAINILNEFKRTDFDSYRFDHACMDFFHRQSKAYKSCH